MRWKKAGKGREKDRVNAGELTAFLDETAEMEGACKFTGTVMLNGRFRGDIVSADTLIIGATAVVHATVRARSVVISGELVGNLVADDRVELNGAARVFGDIEAPVFVVEEGVLFEGHCRMRKGQAEAAPAPLSIPSPSRDLSVVSLKR